jgi:hypothetical protein
MRMSTLCCAVTSPENLMGLIRRQGHLTVAFTTSVGTHAQGMVLFRRCKTPDTDGHQSLARFDILPRRIGSRMSCVCFCLHSPCHRGYSTTPTTQYTPMRAFKQHSHGTVMVCHGIFEQAVTGSSPVSRRALAHLNRQSEGRHQWQGVPWHIVSVIERVVTSIKMCHDTFQVSFIRSSSVSRCAMAHLNRQVGGRRQCQLVNNCYVKQSFCGFLCMHM